MLRRARTAMPSPLADTADEAIAVAAIGTATDALRRCGTPAEAARAALQTIRDAFGWAYGSYWEVCDGELRFVADTGTADTAFTSATRAARYAENDGVLGQARREQDLVHTADLASVRGCLRSAAAHRAGLHSSVCVPVADDSRVVAVIDFFTPEPTQLSVAQDGALRLIAKLISRTLLGLRGRQASAAMAANNDAVSRVLSRLSHAIDVEQAYEIGVNAVRESFEWAYGSVWRLGDDRALHFAHESGSVDAEFREFTQHASFASGVGLPGRAWQQRQLVFVPELTEIPDDVRVPVARRTGVRSGVCMPIIADGQVVATMELLATEKADISDGRKAALSSVAEIVGQTVARLRINDEMRRSAAELTTSVAELAGNASQATTVSTDAVEIATGMRDTIATLVESSYAITQIAKVIAGITRQTHLLALNATIEAARAGEAGRGFAVVAGEVKDLAQATAAANEDVEHRIALIQASAQAVSADAERVAAAIGHIHEMQGGISSVLDEQTAIARRFAG